MKSFVKLFADWPSWFGKLRDSQALKQVTILVTKGRTGGTGVLLNTDLLNYSSHCLLR